jgi:hypothetical protein
MNQPQRPDQVTTAQALSVAAGGAAGVFRGRLVIVTGATPPGSGIFIYNNTGQLIGYWIGIPGTDPIHGSTLSSPGITVQNATVPTITANLQAGGLIFEKLSGVTAPPRIIVQDDTATNAVTTITPTLIQTLLINTFQIDTSGVTETWHNMGLVNGWSGTARYQYNPVGSAGQVYVNLNLDSSSATSQTFCSALPAAYRPASIQYIALGANNNVATGSSAGNASAFFQMQTSGVGQIAPLHAFSTAGSWVGNGSYPLD